MPAVERAEVRQGQRAADHRPRGEHGRGRAAARVGVGRARLGPGVRALVDHHLQAVGRVGVEQRARRRGRRQRDRREVDRTGVDQVDAALDRVAGGDRRGTDGEPVRRAAPVAPSAIVTVPDETVWLAEVELVKVAKVPRPAMLAAAPSTATDAAAACVSGDQPPFRRPRCRCASHLKESPVVDARCRLADADCSSAAARVSLKSKKRQRLTHEAPGSYPRKRERSNRGPSARGRVGVAAARGVRARPARARCSRAARRLRRGGPRAQRGACSRSSGLSRDRVRALDTGRRLRRLQDDGRATASTSRSGLHRRRHLRRRSSTSLGGLRALRPHRASVGGITYRQARHVLAFASAPVALSLFVSGPCGWRSTARTCSSAGGSDHGAGNTAFVVLELRSSPGRWRCSCWACAPRRLRREPGLERG